MRDADLCFMPATEMAHLIRQGALSAREAMATHLAQIERLNPTVNAIVTLTAERAMAQAARADEAQAHGQPLGVLHGLPVAHKDLLDTQGVRTTYGSPIYADHVPSADALLVERLKQAGAISVGKTNTPEFGAGSHTFNTVFGATRNPWDTTKTCGGSSGGAAVALACGMLPIADGSDLGGSLRNPGNFNSIVGFRPSPGRVPGWPQPHAWNSMAVLGPMARNVADTALLLSAMAGADPRAPLSLHDDPAHFRAPLPRDFRDVRIAYAPDLGGLPVDGRITRVIDDAATRLSGLGCQVEHACPDFSGAETAFKALRAFGMLHRAGQLATHRNQMKSTVIWNIEQGLALSAADVSAAEVARTQVYQRMLQFMRRYEFLICPVNQVPPFAIDTEYPTDINGVPMHTYIDWMMSCCYITVTGHPAISVPAGFTADGLPVGLQIVGRAWDDFGVLQLAHAFEAIAGVAGRRPPLCA